MLRTCQSVLIFLIGVMGLCLPSFLHAEGEEDKLLNSAGGMFEAMRDRDIKGIWSFLSEKSKKTIIKEIHQASADDGAGYTIEQIAADMELGGLIARTYWKAFLESFNPKPVLEESRWELGDIKKDKGEIVIQHMKAESPARIKMFKEAGFWKVGLVETFWSGKRGRIMLY